MIITWFIYIALLIYGCQILNNFFSSNKKNKNKKDDETENFSHELEHGPFDEQQQQQYKIPQPSEPSNAPLPSQVSQIPSSELNDLYNNSRIDLSAEVVDPDVEAEATQEKVDRDYEPVASNEVEITTIAPFDQ